MKSKLKPSWRPYDIMCKTTFKVNLTLVGLSWRISCSRVQHCSATLPCRGVLYVCPNEIVGSGIGTVCCGFDPVKLCNLMLRWKLIPLRAQACTQQCLSTCPDLIWVICLLFRLLFHPQSLTIVAFCIESCIVWTAKAFYPAYNSTGANQTTAITNQ